MASTRPSARVWRSMIQHYMSGRPLHDLTRRGFSTSPQRNKSGIPSFEPSSSQDLDSLLTLVRERILVTGLLNTQQQDLVFHPRWRSTLENEPVYATVAGEEIQLRHIDRFRDMPNRWASWNRAIELARTESDWRNMVRMLEGYAAITKDKGIDAARVQKWVRKAREHGQVAKVFQCVQAVRDTGVTLGDAGIAHQVFVGCVSEELRKREYSGKAVKQAWTRVKDLLQYLEMPEHCGKGPLVEGDVRSQPWVLGVVVEASALYFKERWPEADGPKDELVKYVNRLLDGVAATPLNNLIRNVPESANQGSILGAHADSVAKLTPIWNALRLVQEILGPTYERAAEIAEAKDSAASLIEQLVAAVESQKTSGKKYLPVETWKGLDKS